MRHQVPFSLLFFLVLFLFVHFLQADITTNCLNACGQNDIICRAKCVPVPFGGVESVSNTANCIATCQTTNPKDPVAQSQCYSNCFQQFVNPPPHLQPPPLPSPTLPEPTTSSTTTPQATETDTSSESTSRPSAYESAGSTFPKINLLNAFVVLFAALNLIL